MCVYIEDTSYLSGLKWRSGVKLTYFKYYWFNGERAKNDSEPSPVDRYTENIGSRKEHTVKGIALTVYIQGKVLFTLTYIFLISFDS